MLCECPFSSFFEAHHKNATMAQYFSHENLFSDQGKGWSNVIQYVDIWYLLNTRIEICDKHISKSGHTNYARCT